MENKTVIDDWVEDLVMRYASMLEQEQGTKLFVKIMTDYYDLKDQEKAKWEATLVAVEEEKKTWNEALGIYKDNAEMQGRIKDILAKPKYHPEKWLLDFEKTFQFDFFGKYFNDFKKTLMETLVEFGIDQQEEMSPLN